MFVLESNVGEKLCPTSQILDFSEIIDFLQSFIVSWIIGLLSQVAKVFVPNCARAVPERNYALHPRVSRGSREA